MSTSVPVLPKITLVLGGARSGKSAYAQDIAAAGARARPVYIATAQAGDAEMAARIAEHCARRGDAWHTVEEPLDLAGALAGHSHAHVPVVVDCLTLWLSNLMADGRDPEAETAHLIDALARTPGPVVLVANEVGLGIVPENKLARDFRDAHGRLNQAVAAAAGRVVFLAAGLPMVMKDQEPNPARLKQFCFSTGAAVQR